MIDTTPITVFVGPNNSGKSKILAEINQRCHGGQKTASDVIVDTLTFKGFSAEQATEKLQHIELKPRGGDAIRPGDVIIGKHNTRYKVSKHEMLALLQNPASSTNFCQWYLSWNTLMLDGKSRINLVNEQPAGDLQQPPQTSMQVLFRNDQKRAEVSRIIHDAFKQYFVIDPTHLGLFRIRLSSFKPREARTERGIDEEAVQFHAAALPIEHASDGVKAFTGIIVEVMAGDPNILLIDEPEAFLHPALATTLGKEIATAASKAPEKRLFVSTHSPNFVMGCIQSGTPVAIVRLTYREGVATARILPKDDILKLMRNPLLRSTGVLSGLFYEFVVVTESDTDRAFYQEINERLLRFKPEWGIPNCLFINAQNKQTIHTIIRPLRELGIPAAGIVDVDVLKDGGQTWTNLLSGAFVPPLAHTSLGQYRSKVNQACAATGKNMKRQGGIDILAAMDREAANNLFEHLAGYGIFVVRGGELESWLKHLGVSGHGPPWLIDIFEKLGEDPDDSTYQRPADNDVWEFIGDLKGWLIDANRKGISA